jgi:DNA polymerase-3 subunit gamma/tau
MEQFLVSARKYRPGTFKSVVGQQTITNTLKNSIRNNHLAQAFLFCGPRGVGKTTCARILAKTINCLNLTEDTEPCNTCESCTGFNRSASFNIHELDAASNNSVDDIRALIEQVRFAPQIGQYGVYIIDEVHMLSTAAFNAFLKTLEEPPRHAIFILATTERHKILPTILSRCQVFTFNRILVDDIASHLEYVAQSENIKAEPEALHVIAQKADGGLRDALSMFDQIVSYSGGDSVTYQLAIQNLNVLDFDYYFKLTDAFSQGSFSQALLILDDILSHGFDLGNLLSGLSEHFRNLLVCTDAATLPLLEVSAGVKSRYQSQSHGCGPVALIRGIDLLNQTEINLKSARNGRLAAELSFLKLCGLFNPSVLPNEPEKKKDEPARLAQNEARTIQGNTPTQAEEKPVVQALRGITAIRPTVSIKKHLNPQSEESPKSKEVEELVTDHSVREDLPNEAFGKDELIASWNTYAESMRVAGKQALCGNLTIGKPELAENYQVHYQVQNESQLRELENSKHELVQYLQKSLKNYSIRLHLNKAEAPIKTRPYTPEEKLKAMEEKNPHISLLRKSLGLNPG